MKKEIYSGVYCIFNLANGKVYIGQAADLNERYADHWKSNGVNNCHNDYLNKAFAKYTIEGFIFVILNYVELTGSIILDIKHLDELEQFYIDYFEAANDNYGYNIAPNAGTTRGASFYQEEEFKNKISESLKEYYKNNPVSEETKRKIRENLPDNSGENNPMYGTVKPDYIKELLSKKFSGSGNPMYGRRGELSHWFGKANCKKGCELFLHYPGYEKHYFVINNTRFSKEFHVNHISDLVTGKIKQTKGWTGEYAPKWMIDKVKPLMKEGQYWIEVNLEGNIIDG